MNNFYITRGNWNKIIDYATVAHDKWKAEIGGMALMIQDKDEDWHVHRPVILKQEVSGANTSLDKEELAKYYTREAAYMMKKYPKHNYRFLWWHSHHTMAAFWSGTDHKAIEEFSDGDLSFALVVNLKEEYKFRVSIWRPLEIAEDVKLEIVGDPKRVINADLISDVLDKCEEEKPVTTGYNHFLRHGANSPALGDMTAGQTDLWNMDTEEDKYDLLSNECSYNPELSTVIEEGDELCDRFIEGVIQYNTFKNKLYKLRKRLKSIKCMWQVKIPSEAKIYEEIFTYNGFIDMLEYEGENV